MDEGLSRSRCGSILLKGDIQTETERLAFLTLFVALGLNLNLISCLVLEDICRSY